MSGGGMKDVRLSDVITFLTVARARTMAAAARELKVTPSQVTKAMARLERQLGVRLLARTGRGAAVSERGHALAPRLEGLLEALRAAREREGASTPVHTFAAPSYLYHLFLPQLAARIGQVRLRGFELAPTLLRAFAGEGLFDLALLTEQAWMPARWVPAAVGRIRSALFGSPALVKELGGTAVSQARARELTFVAPLYVQGGEVVRGEDFCPLPFAERRLGHEAQTIHTALELAAVTRQVVFGPAVAAGPWVRAGRLQEIHVEGWAVSSPLFLAADGDRVQARLQRAMVAAVQASLEELEREAR
jgi:DNA-binding transcriptional LysR family regulator